MKKDKDYNPDDYIYTDETDDSEETNKSDISIKKNGNIKKIDSDDNSSNCDDSSDDSGDNSDDSIDNEDDNSITNKIILVMNTQNNNKRKTKEKNSNNTRNKKTKYDDIIKKYHSIEKKYFDNLNEQDKEDIYTLEKSLEKNDYQGKEPLRFQLLKLNTSTLFKNIVISKNEQLNKMHHSCSEYFKLSNWMNTFSKIPIGKYHKLNIINSDIASYLQNIKKSLDSNIFGHEETKEQIVRLLAQWISNPDSNGFVIGIHGSPGIGKTKLVQEICKVMEYPLSFISLGGISDSSYLNGHNYTYEGSTYGKIVGCLIKAKVMNPVFLFDELDKVSNTSKGDEIINTLIHLTDPVQNDRYTDKYFEEIDLDLSKSLIIFTYNNENFINPILKDRMKTIKVNGYNKSEKLSIAKDYIIPELLPQYSMKKEELIFEDDLLNYIINMYEDEDGVRSIKRMLNDIISQINMLKYIPPKDFIFTQPYQVSQKFYDDYCKKFQKNKNEKYLSIYT